MIRLVEKGTTLTWGPGLSSDPGSEAITGPAAVHWLWLLLLLLLLVLLGVITPGWWWWRWDRGTDAPLRVMGLGASLLSPICSLLALLGRLQNERLVSATQPVSPLLIRPPRATWGGGTACSPDTACSPFALVQGARSHDRISAGSHTDGMGTPSRCTRDPDPAEGVPAADLVNRHAAIIEDRQRGQDRRPQDWVITERRDILGEYQRFKDKSLPSNPPPGVPAHPRTDRYPVHAGSYRCRSGQ
jgi:hypothetical protein